MVTTEEVTGHYLLPTKQRWLFSGMLAHNSEKSRLVLENPCYKQVGIKVTIIKYWHTSQMYATYH